MSTRKFRPVLTDEDLNIISSSLRATVERMLDEATDNLSIAGWALEFRSHAKGLIDRFDNLLLAHYDRVVADDEVSDGQLTLEEYVEGEDGANGDD